MTDYERPVLRAQTIISGGTTVVEDGEITTSAVAGGVLNVDEIQVDSHSLAKAADLGGMVKVKTLPLTIVAAATEQDSGWTLPDSCMVLDVFLNITTAESTGGTKTVDFGTDGTGSNDPNGFGAAVPVDNAGIVRPQATVTTGSSETYYSANTRGALLADFLAGTDADGDFGIYREKPDGTSGGESVTYTLGSDDYAELDAVMVIVYLELF